MDQERLSKLKKLPSLGVHPYPEKYLDTVSSTQAKELAEKNTPRDTKELMEDTQKSLRIAGRMMTFRSHGKLSFAQLQDFEGRIQIAFVKGVTEVVKNYPHPKSLSQGERDLENCSPLTQVEGVRKEEMPAHKFWEKMLDLGDYIGVEGELFITNHGETTLMVKELTFLGKSLHPLPEKFHGLHDEETILRQRYLDTLTSEESRKRFKMRSDLIKELRKFMWDNKFDEVETPTLEHGATGAAAQPYHTHNNALDIDLVLRISQELPLKKVILGGFERVFEIGKAFRNEGIDPSHLPEHTHFEWYSAYWSFRENMDFSEKMVKHLIKELGIDPVVPIKDKDGNIKNVDFGSDWERIDYVDLIKKDSGIDIMAVRNTEDLRKAIKAKGIVIPDMENMLYPTLVDYLYKKVSRPKIIGPAFLYNYPKALQPLARTNDENPEMVDQFQLVVNGWEIIKGYSELVDPIDQAQRFKEQEGALEVGDEEAMQGDDEYIRAMEQGMPPISGVGLGIDRFITLLTQQDNLRDCVLFPLMRPKGKASVMPDSGPASANRKTQNKLDSSYDDAELQQGITYSNTLKDDSEMRFIAVLNKKVEKGKLMNALGHMSAGLAGGYGKSDDMDFLRYEDKDETIHPNISHYPFIVLKADNSNKIRTLRKEAIKHGFLYTDFVDTMTVGTSKKQVQATKDAEEENLEYFGICLFGKTEELSRLTKKFSLFQ